jgi:type III secretion protein Q
MELNAAAPEKSPMSEIDAPDDCVSADDLASIADAPEPPAIVAPMDQVARAVTLDELARDRVTPAHAKLSRMIAHGCSTRLPHLNALLSLRPVVDDDCHWSDPFLLIGPFGSIEIAQGARLIRALTGVDPGAELSADDERWEWMQAALVARLAGTPLGCAERIGRAAMPDRQDQDDRLTLRITVRTARHSVVAYARAGAATWINFLRRTEWEYERLPMPDFLDLPFEIAIRVGMHTLPRHALKELVTGNIIVPDRPDFRCDGTGFIRLGVLLARVLHQAPGSFKITSAGVNLSSLELEQNEAGDTADEPEYGAQSDADNESALALRPPELPAEPDGLASPSDLDTLPVTLDFHIGKVRMSLRELRALGVGSIVTSDASPSSISIRSGGRLLGSGELVDVKGQLAVRITRWGVK